MYNCCEHCVHWSTFSIINREDVLTPELVTNDHQTPCLYNETLPNATSCVDGKVKANAT